MIVKELQRDQKDYLDMASDAILFVQPEWIAFIGQKIRLFGIYKGESLKAIFHLYEYSKFTKTFVINSPFSSNCGLSFQISGTSPYSRQSDVKRIIRCMAEFIRSEYPGTFISFTLPQNVIDTQPFILRQFSVSPRYTYRLSLAPSEAEMLSNMSPERRKNIRQAKKEGYQLEWNSNPTATAKLIGETLSDAKIHLDNFLIEKLFDKRNTFCTWVTVKWNGDIRAVAVLGMDKHTAYYFAGGHDKASGDQIAGTLALWQIILKARESGISYFDFHGSSIPSIEQYFRGFGGELTPYYRISDETQWVVQLKKIKKQLGI